MKLSLIFNLLFEKYKKQNIHVRNENNFLEILNKKNKPGENSGKTKIFARGFISSLRNGYNSIEKIDKIFLELFDTVEPEQIFKKKFLKKLKEAQKLSEEKE